MCEIFFELVVRYAGLFESALAFNGKLLQSREIMYAVAMNKYGAPLNRSIGFLYCTKIRMPRPGGHRSLPCIAHPSHKRFHCLIYQTMKTPHGLMIARYGSEEVWRHGTTMFRKIKWGETLWNVLLINSPYLFRLRGFFLIFVSTGLKTVFTWSPNWFPSDIKWENEKSPCRSGAQIQGLNARLNKPRLFHKPESREGPNCTSPQDGRYYFELPWLYIQCWASKKVIPCAAANTTEVHQPERVMFLS